MIIKNTRPDTHPTRVLQDDELTLGVRVEFNDEYEAEVDDDVGEQVVSAVDHFESGSGSGDDESISEQEPEEDDEELEE